MMSPDTVDEMTRIVSTADIVVIRFSLGCGMSSGAGGGDEDEDEDGDEDEDDADQLEAATERLKAAPA
ncbi:hypothetical protein DL767_003981 [Monosporascus sp. MG133]|nr:hypothetical protein DL767_003981 [Monosporascus sp. MG133]